MEVDRGGNVAGVREGGGWGREEGIRSLEGGRVSGKGVVEVPKEEDYISPSLPLTLSLSRPLFSKSHSSEAGGRPRRSIPLLTALHTRGWYTVHGGAEEGAAPREEGIGEGGQRSVYRRRERGAGRASEMVDEGRRQGCKGERERETRGY